MRMTLNQCALAIIDQCSNVYAKAYARECLAQTTWEGAKAQIPYMLSNIAQWRGPVAETIKTELKYIDSLVEVVD